MKVLITLISEDWAGAERVVYKLVDIMSKSEEITLAINNEMKPYYKNLKKIKIIYLGNINSGNIINKFYSLLKIKKNLFNLLKEKEFDVINSHMDLSLLISTNSDNLVTTFHGSDVNDFINSRKLYYSLFIRPLLSNRLNKVNKIISVSRHQIIKIPKRYKKKTIVIPNGVDSDIFKPLSKIKQMKNVVLFAGRFIDIKGIQEIVNVAKKLPKYEFWFAGQGELEKYIRGKNVNNLGFKTTEELVKLYNQANVCIFPSHREGLPLCGLEAMACGRAVIATPLGFSEYIEDGIDGIIIPAKDENALKDAIVNLMTNEKKRKMLEKNARKKALQYSWDKIAKRYLQIFLEVSRL